MRFALFISKLSGGGAERVMSLLANHWVARGDSVVLVTYECASSDYPLDPRVERISLGMHRVSKGVPDALMNNWRRLAALRRTLRAARPSVVISFEERMNAFVLLVALGRGVLRIISERTDPRLHQVAPFWAALRRLTYPLADALVVQTEAVRPWACRAMLDKSRVHVIANPVRNMERYVRAPAQRSLHSVVAVGRLVDEKGFDVLLRAFASVGTKYAHWRLVIVGDGLERLSLLALAKELAIADRLTITGWVAEPGEVLASADIYVLSSRYEGFPNALLEAMSCGVPVVATTCAGAAEILTHAIDGLLVPVGAVPELTSAMVRLMADAQLRRQLAGRALATAERYKIDVIAGRWDKVISTPVFPARTALQEFREITPRREDIPTSAPSILFLARDLDVGGAQRQMIDLAAGLHERGWKVIVATFYAGGALETELGDIGVQAVCLHKKGRWEIGGFLLRLVRLLRSQRPQIAHGLLVMPNILLALLKPLTRETRVVWGIAASDMDLNRYDWVRRLEFRASVRLAPCADLMISNSRAGLHYHAAAGYPAERIVVIPNGVDVDRFRPNSGARQRLRTEWAISADETLVGIVGRLDPMKDHVNFLHAAADVAAVRRNIRFICVGDGSAAYRETLEQLGNRLRLGERLIWAGTREDISDVYNALDVKVCSSLSEGLPNVVVEAMATGIPCVVTDVGDSAEVVDGLGWVCPPKDSAALAAAILRALESLPTDPAALRQTICTRYSASVRLERTISELSHLMEPGTACLEQSKSIMKC